MTIEDYIKKHGLVERHIKSTPFSAWIPASVAVPDDHDSRIFTDDGATHMVVVDTTVRKFRIVHRDIAPLETDWLDSETDYQSDSRPFW
jgi:hypothetical protein